MGGIVGVLRRDGQGAERALLVRQTERLAVRGPDDGAVYLEGPVGLGFRRLDAEGRGHQPHWDEESRLAVLFDGELTGLERLRAVLEGRGHAIVEPDPTTVLLAAYRQWGDAFVERLEGSFALALLDRRGPRVLLARDRVGRRPLYIHIDRRRCAFASELDTLLEVPGVPRLLDPAAVVAWFRQGFVPEPGTLVRDVRAVPPGTVLSVEPDRVRARHYAGAEAEAASPEGAFRDLREASRSAVDAALEGDPVLLLSGGRASGLIAAGAARRGRRALRAFHLRGLEPRPDLGADGIAPPLVDVAPPPPLETLRAALRAMDHPLGDAAFVTEVAAAAALARTLRDGAPWIVGHGLREALGEPPLPGADATRALDPRLRRSADAGLEPTAPAVRLASHALRRLDRLSVAFERPVRAPFASASLAARAARIGAPGPTVARLARGEISTELAARPSAQPLLPLERWMRGPVNDLVESLLFDVRGGRSGVLDGRRLRRWWYEHQLGVTNRAPLLWRALVFEHWYRCALLREAVLPAHKRRRRRRPLDTS